MDVAKSSRPACTIDHVAIAVENLDSAIEFYTGSLGLIVVERRHTVGDATGMISAVLTGAGIPIVLVQGTEPDSQVSRFVARHGSGVQHLAFAVNDMDDQLNAAARAGLRPAFPSIDGDGIRQIFLDKTGDGPRIELIERSGGTFNDASIREIFLAMEARNLV